MRTVMYQISDTEGRLLLVIQYYYYPGTQQEFRTYEDLMRYVNYAMAAKLGPYSPVAKSISSQRRKKDPEDTVPTKLRKKPGSSRGRKRSSVPRSKSKPLAYDQRNGSDTDMEEDPEMTVSDSSRTDTDDEDWYPQAADFASME
ncbi:hypothetical protein L6164_003830 [Bauhinia variegata]|uniref:Uncharacterized protein n=1 Tax=Bauhinia variegata TaxID=167791 RepID=A0ACB9Q2K6_BAUVA|nr:hypothetical protein L6164_003830 [Bauhinia variegata]